MSGSDFLRIVEDTSGSKNVTREVLQAAWGGLPYHCKGELKVGGRGQQYSDEESAIRVVNTICLSVWHRAVSLVAGMIAAVCNHDGVLIGFSAAESETEIQPRRRRGVALTGELCMSAGFTDAVRLLLNTTLQSQKQRTEDWCDGVDIFASESSTGGAKGLAILAGVCDSGQGGVFGPRYMAM